ncbi:MAG: carbohydrate binding domain-containing protein [ANME-2 cluster archaeon]|nr:carbohydrate binding domain-containing protein [ANME-2 cluster archaeon]
MNISCIVILVWILMAGNASAIGDPYIVYGYVRYDNGGPVNGANVIVSVPNQTMTEITNSDGKYVVVLDNYTDGDIITVTASLDTYTANIENILNKVSGGLLINVILHGSDTMPPGSDITPPAIAGNEPSGPNVPVTTQIQVNFSEEMNQASAESVFSTSPVTAGSFNWNGKIMTYTPDLDLTFDTTYTVTIGTDARDLANNSMQTGHTWQFTTEAIPTSANLIMNPDFGSGTSQWLFYTSGTGTFSVASPGYEENNAAKLALNRGGTNIQLYQKGIALEPNTRYRFSFAGYSTTGHDVNVRLIKHGSPYTNYGLDFTADLGTHWQTFTTEFTSSDFTNTVNNGRLQFWLAPFAASGDTYYIDDIRLEKVSALELPIISTHPADQTVALGQTATLSVVAAGTAPLTYQWQKNSMDIPGATGPSYTTPATILSDSGSTFRVRVTNPVGSIMSNTATCTVGVQKQAIQSSILNSGFESGTTPWKFYTNGAGTFSMASPGYEGNNAARLVLSSAGMNIQLYQKYILLEPNTRYRLSFAAYSTTGHDMAVKLFKHATPYTAYSPDFIANLGTSWQTFTTEFTTGGFTGTVNDGRLQFWLAPFAASGDQYFIDDVILVKV